MRCDAVRNGPIRRAGRRLHALLACLLLVIGCQSKSTGDSSGAEVACLDKLRGDEAASVIEQAVADREPSDDEYIAAAAAWALLIRANETGELPGDPASLELLAYVAELAAHYPAVQALVEGQGPSAGPGDVSQKLAHLDCTSDCSPRAAAVIRQVGSAALEVLGNSPLKVHKFAKHVWDTVSGFDSARDFITASSVTDAKSFLQLASSTLGVAGYVAGLAGAPAVASAAGVVVAGIAVASVIDTVQEEKARQRECVQYKVEHLCCSTTSDCPKPTYSCVADGIEKVEYFCTRGACEREPNQYEPCEDDTRACQEDGSIAIRTHHCEPGDTTSCSGTEMHQARGCTPITEEVRRDCFVTLAGFVSQCSITERGYSCTTPFDTEFYSYSYYSSGPRAGQRTGECTPAE